jgi:DNA polymerase-3 subunit delta'
MIWEKIRGHSEQVDMFRRALQRNRLAHAYLFIGPDGTGKRLFANSLGWCLFCERFPEAELEACGECSACRQMMAGTHPDHLAIGLPAGKKELPIELFRGPPERKGREGLCHDLSLKPMAGMRRVAVIDDADRMNAASANALLKTLEEPPPNSLLILIASNVDSLLPTIRSRCQQIRFSPLADADVAELLLDLKLTDSATEANTIAGLCEGSLTTAKSLLEPGLRALRERLYSTLSAGQFEGLTLAKGLLDGLDELGGDTAEQRRNGWWLVRFTVEFYRRTLRRLSDPEAVCSADTVDVFAGRLPAGSADSIERVMEMFERAATAERQLDRHAPLPLCLEGLYDELARMHRQAVDA